MMTLRIFRHILYLRWRFMAMVPARGAGVNWDYLEIPSGLSPEARRIALWDSLEIPSGLSPDSWRIALAILRSSESSVRVAELVPGSENLELPLAYSHWFNVWAESSDGPRVTLSAWAADRLEVELVERSRVVFMVPDEEHEKRYTTLAEVARWEPRFTIKPRPKMPRVKGFVSLPYPDLVPCRQVEPEPVPEPEPEIVPELTPNVILMTAIVVEMSRRKPSSKPRKPKPCRACAPTVGAAQG